MINWNAGYSAVYYATFVDPDSWKDVEKFEITGGSISRTDSDLRQSADINTVNYEFNEERWIRIWMISKQSGNGAHTPLFTGLATSPSITRDGNLVNNTLQCYSVLKPAKDILLPKGWYVAKDVDCREIIRQLTSVLPCQVDIQSDTEVKLLDYIVAENNENYLSMLEKVLNAINWRLQINGYGDIWIGEYSNNEVITFDSRFNDILETSISLENDWYSVPNVLRVIGSDGTEYVEYDNDENHPYSIPNRGREVWVEESNVDTSYGESLELYAKRRLEELQQYSEKVSYTRRYVPDVYVDDVIRLNYPAQGISGAYYIISQNITLGYNASTSEEVIKLWGQR